MKGLSLTAVLKQASKGLLFPSESDAPLKPFVWDQPDAPTPEALVEDAGMDAGTPTETMSLLAFFRAIPKAEKPKFDALTKVLKENLSGIKVHKIGDVNLKVYILGKTKDGQWAGLTTEVVET
jgi:hypothetical protein